jgi:protein O-GlcNAc transferase
MPTDSVFDRAFALHQSGRFAEAEAMYRQALAVSPDSADAQISLANLLFQMGRPDEAVAASRRGLVLRPTSFEAYNTLGNSLGALGQPREALEAYNRALAMEPGNAIVHYNAAAVLKALGDRAQAEAALGRAIQLKADFPEALTGLGMILAETSRLKEAVELLRRALAVKPDIPEAMNALGKSLKDLGRIEEAMEILQRAAALRPDYANAHNTLGNVLLVMGRVEESIEAYRRAIQLDPQLAIAHSNLIFAMNFDPRFDAAAILREARQWNDRHGKPQRPIPPHDNDRDPDRRLRIGYVSSDFRQHVVAWNLLPLLGRHDPGQVEVFCFSGGAHSDAMTDRLRSRAHHWRDVSSLSDAQLAEKIREDRIDLLIDLSLHSAGNRLGAFALVPAPVQITYLGYCGTSGMDAMHFRFSDPHLDPSDADLSCYSERTVRLPETYWCYAPAQEAPDPSPPPAEGLGYVTFGCLNQLAKASRAAMELWCEILTRVPRSRLLLHAQPGKYLSPGNDFFDSHGVAADRVEFVPRRPWDQYTRTYHRIDIALDPFPYNGGITTCDALWMGVPVVSLSGQTAVGRAGRSILSNVGLHDLIANDSAQYVQRAVELAGDVAKLGQWRSSLRQRMKSSPLMDAPRFARNVEAAYRQAWRRWCAQSV